MGFSWRTRSITSVNIRTNEFLHSTIFDSLVMDPTLKGVIYQLIIAHRTGVSDFDDFVKGKGKGLIGLLFGPPGSGKTLTAEAIAETGKMPLYAVSSGALGHGAEQIHNELSKILRLASHWKAILLLDEADVFLAQRTVSDIERNSIVSVFLRELEYYQGVLLLTTNQAEIIDEAFQSGWLICFFPFHSHITDRIIIHIGRIHLSLKYPGLDTAARLKIWKSFITKVGQHGSITADISEEELSHLSEMQLNGRQVREISDAKFLAAAFC